MTRDGVVFRLREASDETIGRASRDGERDHERDWPKMSLHERLHRTKCDVQRDSGSNARFAASAIGTPMKNMCTISPVAHVIVAGGLRAGTRENGITT